MLDGVYQHERECGRKSSRDGEIAALPKSRARRSLSSNKSKSKAVKSGKSKAVESVSAARPKGPIAAPKPAI